MAAKETPESFDVIVVGSGAAGALVAYKLALAGKSVLILEAGKDFPQRDAANPTSNILVKEFRQSASKNADSPYTDALVAAQPRAGEKGLQHYVKRPSAVKAQVPFQSYYERIVGGSMSHWQAISIRYIPADFRLKTRYGVGFDWPIGYEDLEPWYCEAEREMGVAGSEEDAAEVLESLFNATHSRRYPHPDKPQEQIRFPMPEVPASYLDKYVGRALNGKAFENMPLRVTPIPQARNSRPFDGRPVCDGRLSCIPLCPTKAKYESLFHIEKAISKGAVLKTQAIVTQLTEGDRHRIRTVHYQDWAGNKASANARVIVLAANGIETPKILLMSQSVSPTGAANKSGLVGCNLMDHPRKVVWGLARDPVYSYRGPLSTSHIQTLRDGQFRNKRAAFLVTIRNDGWQTGTGAPRGNAFPVLNPLTKEWLISPQDEDCSSGQCRIDMRGADQDTVGTLVDFVRRSKLFGRKLREKIHDHCNRQVVITSACEQLPQPENRVSISTLKDRHGVPRPEISYCLDGKEQPYVIPAFDAMETLHREIFAAIGAKNVFVDPQRPNSFAGSGHLMGTTMMGSDPSKSVVDGECRAHDHSNLFILGSSAFPSGSVANPTLTIAALALRCAQTILNDL